MQCEGVGEHPKVFFASDFHAYDFDCELRTARLAETLDGRTLEKSNLNSGKGVSLRYASPPRPHDNRGDCRPLPLLGCLGWIETLQMIDMKRGGTRLAGLGDRGLRGMNRFG